MMACERCREVFSKDGPLQIPAVSQDNRDSDMDEEKDSLKAQLRELELELAQTKLQLVEAKCKIQVRLHSTGSHTTRHDTCSSLDWNEVWCTFLVVIHLDSVQCEAA